MVCRGLGDKLLVGYGENCWLVREISARLLVVIIARGMGKLPVD